MLWMWALAELLCQNLSNLMPRQMEAESVIGSKSSILLLRMALGQLRSRLPLMLLHQYQGYRRSRSLDIPTNCMGQLNNILQSHSICIHSTGNHLGSRESCWTSCTIHKVGSVEVYKQSSRKGSVFPTIWLPRKLRTGIISGHGKQWELITTHTCSFRTLMRSM